MDNMTQEEFLKEYQGKFIEIPGKREVAWLFEVDSADFSKGNQNFLGWIGAKNVVLGTIELKQVENLSHDSIILREEDKITIYDSKEALEARVLEFVKENITEYEKRDGN